MRIVAKVPVWTCTNTPVTRPRHRSGRLLFPLSFCAKSHSVALRPAEYGRTPCRHYNGASSTSQRTRVTGERGGGEFGTRRGRAAVQTLRWYYLTGRWLASTLICPTGSDWCGRVDGRAKWDFSTLPLIQSVHLNGKQRGNRLRSSQDFSPHAIQETQNRQSWKRCRDYTGHLQSRQGHWSIHTRRKLVESGAINSSTASPHPLIKPQTMHPC